MARTGVTQEQVDAAADALLRAGERPTIERVRALLGTGSPNTLVRLIDAWWGRLGSRLTAVEAKLALPSAPEAAVKAASEFWSAALTHATALATEGMEQERVALEHAKTHVSARAEELARDKAEASRLIAVAEDARSRAETRCQDLELLIAELRRQLDETHQDRQLGRNKIAELERLAAAQAEQLANQTVYAAAEIDRLLGHVRSVEDRAHAEVDRVREEIKASNRRIAQLEKEGIAAATAAQRRVLEAESARKTAEIEAARADARLRLLDKRLENLAELHRAPQKADPRSSAGGKKALASGQKRSKPAKASRAAGD